MAAIEGYDAMYYIPQVGEQAQRGGEHYTWAVAQGEPPGYWQGRAARRLGFEPGQRVENEPYLKLLNERRAPHGRSSAASRRARPRKFTSSSSRRSRTPTRPGGGSCGCSPSSRSASRRCTST